jgi:hypothetical protein
LLVVAAVLALVALVWIPSMREARDKARQIDCANNLKQIGFSFRLWSTDSTDDFPQSASTNRGGTLEVSNEVWRTMLSMSNELATPKILNCPSDNRQPAGTWATLANSNISYFIGLDGTEACPEIVLGGDRFLSTGRPATNKVLVIMTNDSPVWAANHHQGSGNLMLSDGSVQAYTKAKMRQAIKRSLELNWEDRTNATLHFALPE